MKGHTSDVFALATLTNGNLASVSMYEYTIQIWNLNRRSLLFTLAGHTNRIKELAALSNGNLASASDDNTIRIWNPNTGLLVSKLNIFELYFCAWYFVALVRLENDNLAFTCNSDVKTFNPNTGSLLFTLTGHTNFILKLATLPNGNLASVSYDSTIKIWNPNNGSLLFTLTDQTQQDIWTLAALSNGNLASGSNDNTIKIWNPNNGSLVFTLTGHTHRISSLAALPNGNLASGSGDSTIKLWNPNNGSLLYTLIGHIGYVFSLVTLPNGNLASGSTDKTIKIWSLNPLAYSNITFSGYSSTEFNFKILNDQEVDLTLYWIDQSRNFINYANIKIGQTYFQQSYSSHVWVLSNSLNNKCFVFKLSSTNQFALSNQIVRVSNMSDIQCNPKDVPSENSYWKTKDTDHYFAVSPNINGYCYEFENGKIIYMFTLYRKDSSKTVLFDSSRSSSLVLTNNTAWYSYMGNPYKIYKYGGWVSSKKNNFNF